jgi:uncharacterized protein with ParB-like and HNH nuclease domain
VWNSDKEIPYRYFIEDYDYSDVDTTKFVDKNLWKREDKWLVYDGQQRLQTLFSCLKYTLNDRVLSYNLFFDLDNHEDAEATGFEFVNKNTDLRPGVIAIPQLFIQDEDSKVKYRKDMKSKIPAEIMDGNEEKFENIIDKLWDVFIRKDVKSLAFFPIEKNWDEGRVNDVFQRLNMGGVPLSGADLLLSRIKDKSHDYEEKLQLESKQIFAITQGYKFEPSSILQLVHLIIKKTNRIAPERVKAHEIMDFITVFNDLKGSIDDFFKHFIYDSFKINNNSIVIRGGALYPLILYIYNRHKKGFSYMKIENKNLKRMKQYFILSQLNDWNTQTIINECSALALGTDTDFPLDAMKDFVGKNNRLTALNVSTIEGYIWFPLKVLIPDVSYISSGDVAGRYKPELDHIFPMKLNGRPANYNVNVLWNMQPITGVINASKGNTHPKTFFSSPENSKYINQYNFLPDALSAPEWSDHLSFIAFRKQKMIDCMRSKYDIVIDPS